MRSHQQPPESGSVWGRPTLLLAISTSSITSVRRSDRGMCLPAAHCRTVFRRSAWTGSCIGMAAAFRIPNLTRDYAFSRLRNPIGSLSNATGPADSCGIPGGTDVFPQQATLGAALLFVATAMLLDGQPVRFSVALIRRRAALHHKIHQYRWVVARC